jgi:hypothetical protein
VNGSKNWFHISQTPDLTFISFHPSGGKSAQERFYPEGLLYAILVTDYLAVQLFTPAAAYQIYLAHILRELCAFLEAYPEEPWPGKMMTLLLKALTLRGLPSNPKGMKAVERDCARLLKSNQSCAPGKIPTLWKRLNIHRDKVFTFLYYKGVPSDNNAPERAIRCVKVKQKLSGQFKTQQGAHRYAMNCSMIDTPHQATQKRPSRTGKNRNPCSSVIFSSINNGTEIGIAHRPAISLPSSYGIFYCINDHKSASYAIEDRQ